MSLSAEALALRIGRITGTTAAAILGVHPHVTAREAYEQIVGAATVEQNERMVWGLRLQALVATEFAERHDVLLEECDTLVHPEHNWLAATGDYRIVGAEDLLEVKTAGERQAHRWGADGTDQVPEEYWIQCVVQMAVYEARSVWVAVLLGGNDYREYRVWRNPSEEAEILTYLERFHHAIILPRVEPPGTPAERLASLENRYPRHEGPMRDAPPEAAPHVERYRTAKAAEAYAKAQKEEAKAAICELIGEAAGLRGDGWEATWKRTKDGEAIDWQAVAKLAGCRPEQVLAHTKVREGYRQFRCKFIDDTSEGDE